MKIMTFNLQAFKDWEQRKTKIVEYISSENPDVICFQEVVYLDEVSSFNQVQLLNAELHFSFIHTAVTRLQPSPDYTTYREGLGVLSRFPITSSDVVVLKQEEGDDCQRIVQLIDMEIDGALIKIANIHFSITDLFDYATPHLKETLALLRCRNEQRIIVGDFNLTHLEDSKALWGSEYTASTAVSYVTYPAEDKRVDYALIPINYRFNAINVSNDGLSDHRALSIEIAKKAA